MTVSIIPLSFFVSAPHCRIYTCIDDFMVCLLLFKEASRYNFGSGSTATVILIADSQILAANVGDSKAFLCSETFQSPREAKG